ncbi:MAG: hypothetical protein H6R19_1945 [Proteobacteria bacterium]|nr:hypothetical protein [Pseudomonadota bacterium]
MGKFPTQNRPGYLEFLSKEDWPANPPEWLNRELIKDRLIAYAKDNYELQWLPEWLETNSWTPPPPRKFSEKELLEQEEFRQLITAGGQMIQDLNRRWASSQRPGLNQLKAPKEQRKLNWFQNFCGYLSLLVIAAVFAFQIYSCTSSTH